MYLSFHCNSSHSYVLANQLDQHQSHAVPECITEATWSQHSSTEWIRRWLLGSALPDP